jgi:hypothetical protein
LDRLKKKKKLWLRFGPVEKMDEAGFHINMRNNWARYQMELVLLSFSLNMIFTTLNFNSTKTLQKLKRYVNQLSRMIKCNGLNLVLSFLIIFYIRIWH